MMWCKLCSIWELTKQLDCKSMEIKWNIYIKVGIGNKGYLTVSVTGLVSELRGK